MSRLLDAFYATRWAIIPDRLPVIRAVLERWAAGEKLSDEQIRAAVGDGPSAAAARRSRESPRGIAVVPVLGILAQRTAGNISSPGTATDSIARQVRALVDDSSVEAIVLDIDSPGGSVFGIESAAAAIYEGRSRKPIVAVANSLAASAAYWIGSAASEFVVAPGGQVGSIGVIAAHEDHSRELEAKGVDVTLITAGKYKGEGNPFGPLNDEAKAAISKDVRQYYSAFVSDVARHRGVSINQVTGGFGEGRTVSASDAVREDMVDSIETLDDVLARLSGRRSRRQGLSAASARRRLAAMELAQYE